MRRRSRLVLLALLPALSCGRGGQAPEHVVSAVHPDLEAHSAEFEPAVIEVTDGVHVAVGYGLANSILIEGEDGVVVVDTLESAEAARPVKAEFDEITRKPLKAIIYTHNHADHVFGAGVFAGDGEPEVYSHEKTLERLDSVLTVVRPIVFERSMRQFGTFLPQSLRVNDGIGPRLLNDGTTTAALIRPNRTFAGEDLDVEIAGVRMKLVFAPGETPDQIFVWLPDKKVLLPGDNFYKSFPNLYAIRGTPYRDVMDWVGSLDRMRALGAEHLVPSHTRPISGAAEIEQALTDYRDAIQYVHDQTVRGMNQGLDPDELVERVKLPEHLARKPYLHEYYGRVDWSVRSIFAGYLGWFGGNASGLERLPPAERARRFVALGGGAEPLLDRARVAAEEGESVWALELADQVLLLEPGNRRAAEIRAAALRALGERQVSANGRNYYLSQALEAAGELTIAPMDPSSISAELLRNIPVGSFMRAMSVNLDPEKSAGDDEVVVFTFPDVGESYTIHLRRGVAEVRAGAAEDPDVRVTVDSLVWKEILARKRSAVTAYATGAVQVEGGAFELASFLGRFRS